jgi:hypothetical protein
MSQNKYLLMVYLAGNTSNRLNYIRQESSSVEVMVASIPEDYNTSMLEDPIHIVMF